jgi:hypothetical protein
MFGYEIWYLIARENIEDLRTGSLGECLDVKKK